MHVPWFPPSFTFWIQWAARVVAALSPGSVLRLLLTPKPPARIRARPPPPGLALLLECFVGALWGTQALCAPRKSSVFREAPSAPAAGPQRALSVPAHLL